MNRFINTSMPPPATPPPIRRRQPAPRGTAPARMAPPVFTNPLLSVPPPPWLQQLRLTMFTVPPPPFPPIFDPSRPPPPPPQTSNLLPGRRRPADQFSEPGPGPSKLRKTDSKRPCKECLKIKLRIETYRLEIEKLELEKERKTYEFQKQMKEFENSYRLIKSIASPEESTLLDEYIEGSPEVAAILAEYDQVPGTSTSEPTYMPQYLTDPSHVPSEAVEEPNQCALE